jgi:hypothetical protein
MRCSIATAWSSAAAGRATVRAARRCRRAPRPTIRGAPNYKGEFKLGNGRYCYPLTVTDHASRFLLLCEALESTREELAFTAFERNRDAARAARTRQIHLRIQPAFSRVEAYKADGLPLTAMVSPSITGRTPRSSLPHRTTSELEQQWQRSVR